MKQPGNDSADPAAGGVASCRHPSLAARCLLAARHRDFHDRGVTRRHRLAASLSKLRCPTMCWGSEVTHGSGHHGLDSICSAMNLSAEDGSLHGRIDVWEARVSLDILSSLLSKLCLGSKKVIIRGKLLLYSN